MPRGGKAGPWLDRLEATELEGREVARMLGAEQLWLQNEAVESKLKRIRSPRILHIATHGFFLKNQPFDPNRHVEWGIRSMTFDAPTREWAVAGVEDPLLRSGLALAGTNTWLDGSALPHDAEDGLFTAADVTGVDLMDTEMVVLSACDTGRGDVRVGEGVFGLRRSFVVAGAKTLVTSLWKVPDRQTQELMVDFYDRLMNGQPRAVALREAQLAMKQKDPHRHPYYWGAFICQGDPSPLHNTGPLTTG